MLFGGLAGLAVDAFSRPATLIRVTLVRAENGTFSQSDPIETAIQASIQAPSEQDIRQLPEGERTEAYVTIHSRAALQTASEDGRTVADRVRSELGETFKVTRILRRSEADFTRAIARLENDRDRTV